MHNRRGHDGLKHTWKRGGRAQRRWRAVTAQMAVAAVLTTSAACTATPGPPAATRGVSAAGTTTAAGSPAVGPVRASQVAVTAGTETHLIAPDGPTVRIPGAAVKGTGRLTVTPTTVPNAPAGASSWTVELTGASLVGDATLSFPATAGTPDPLVGYVDASGFHPMRTTRSGSTVSVTTPHFSTWTLFSWDPFKQWARDQLDRIYAQTAAGKQPVCEGRDQLAGRGVTVSSSSGQRVMWCVGTRSGGTFLKVVNTRGYMMRMEYTPGLKLAHGSTASIIAPALAGMVEQSRHRGNKVVIIGSGEELEFTVTAPGEVGVQLAPSPAAMLVTAAEYAARTIAELSKFTGLPAGLILSGSKVGPLKGEQLGPVVLGADVVGCIQGLVTHFTGSPGNATELNTYLINAIDTSFGCFEQTMRDQMGFIGGTLVSGFTWIVSGLTTAANSLGAAADSLFNPDPYRVLISTKAPAPSQPGVNWDFASWKVGWDHIGPYNVGMQGKDAVARGLVKRFTGDNCAATLRYVMSDRVQAEFGQGLFTEWRGGQSPDKLDMVVTTDRRIATETGAIRVGDSRAKVLRSFPKAQPYKAFLSSEADDLVAYGPNGYAILFDFDESFAASAPVTMITATRGNSTDGPDPYVGEC